MKIRADAEAKYYRRKDIKYDDGNISIGRPKCRDGDNQYSLNGN
jgi:hypothetical protein